MPAMKRSRWGGREERRGGRGEDRSLEDDALKALLQDAGVDGDAPKASDKQETKLFVGNVARDFYGTAAETADALRGLFEEYGKVADVQ